MYEGKAKCKVLKGIRQKIADNNGIKYSPCECHHKGDCSGTCPACEQEIRYIERELKARRKTGKLLKMAGIAAGVTAILSPIKMQAQNAAQISPLTPVLRAQLETLDVVDFSNGSEDAVVVRGLVLFASDSTPLTGASVIYDKNKGVVTNIDGLFAIKVPRDAELLFKYIGCADKTLKVDELKSPDSVVVYIDELPAESVLCGEIVVIKHYDDVYYRSMSSKPKSRKDKNSKTKSHKEKIKDE